MLEDTFWKFDKSIFLKPFARTKNAIAATKSCAIAQKDLMESIAKNHYRTIHIISVLVKKSLKQLAIYCICPCKTYINALKLLSENKRCISIRI